MEAIPTPAPLKAISRSLPSTTGGSTRPSVTVRSIITPPANTHCHWCFCAHEHTVGDANTASGLDVLVNNNHRHRQHSLGTSALASTSPALATRPNGFSALDANTTGNGNIALGSLAGANLTTGSNNIDIGNVGVAGESSTIRLGHDRNPDGHLLSLASVGADWRGRTGRD